MGKPKPLPPRSQSWVDARKRHRLSHAHVQMARELGLNPTKPGKLDNHQQEPWKAPLPQFIEHLYASSSAANAPTSSGPSRRRHASLNVAALSAKHGPLWRIWVSEYQYYEFLAVDRALDVHQLDEVRAMSTRAHITPTSFVNTYHWGNFHGDTCRGPTLT